MSTRVRERELVPEWKRVPEREREREREWGRRNVLIIQSMVDDRSRKTGGITRAFGNLAKQKKTSVWQRGKQRKKLSNLNFGFVKVRFSGKKNLSHVYGVVVVVLLFSFLSLVRFYSLISKWAYPGHFSVFSNKQQIFTNKCEKCPSSIRYWDSNSPLLIMSHLP